MDDLSLRKLAHNEALFREVNEQIHEVRDNWGREENTYICECANADCFETITLNLETYTRVRSDERRFVVVPGHELPELERVVEREPTFLIVEKLVPVPQA